MGDIQRPDPQNFVVPNKFCFKQIIKTKILAPKNLFFPTNLKIRLRTCCERILFVDIAKNKWLFSSLSCENIGE